MCAHTVSHGLLCHARATHTCQSSLTTCTRACVLPRAGNGSMVGALVGSTKREPLTVGKPSEFMLENIANTFKLQRSEICMVGDRLDTDIMFGKNGGLATCLVLSGACAPFARLPCVCALARCLQNGWPHCNLIVLRARMQA